MSETAAIHLSEQDFVQRNLRKPGVWVVDFGAAWCPPCRVVAPILRDLAASSEGRVQVGEVDADEETDLAARFQVGSLPTMLLFRDGQLLDRRIGSASRSTLSKWIDSALA